MSGPRARAALSGLMAMVVLAAVTTGLPVALLRFGGSPIPRGILPWHRVLFTLLHADSSALFLTAVRDTSWLAWLAFTIAVLVEAHAQVRGRRAPRLHLAGLQGAAGRLVAVASLTFATPAMATLVASPALAASADHAGHFTSGIGTVTVAQRIVVVRPGECLWTIAERYLGSGDRYREIVRLNLGRPVGDGAVFTTASLILPGWHLRVPAKAAPEHNSRRSSRHHRDEPVSPSQGQHMHDGHPHGDRRFGRPHAAAGPVRQGADDGAAGAQSRSADAGPAGDPGGSAIAVGGSRAGDPLGASSSAGEATAATGTDVLEQVALFTLGLVAGSVVASLETLRHRQRQYRRPGRRIAMPSGAAALSVEQKLRSAAPGCKPESLRDALQRLGEGVTASGDVLPPIAGIHLTQAAIEVLLCGPAAGPPPQPFTIAPARQGMCWTAELDPCGPDAGGPPAPGEVGDFLPGLFTAGATRAGGYLLLDLEAMRVTCCDGQAELVDRMLVTAATELASSRWSGWYELVLTGFDELDVLGRAEHCRDLDDALDVLQDRVDTIASRLGDERADVRACRLEDPEDEDWGLTLLVSRIRPTPGQMARLLELTDGPGGVAALIAGDTQTGDGKIAQALFRLEADQELPGEIVASITIANLGPQKPITVWPQTLTVSEYEALAEVLAVAADTADVSPDAAPYQAGGAPWMRFAAAPVSAADGESFARPLACPEPGSDDDEDAGPGDDWPERRDRAARLQVRVLGAVEVLGSAEPLAPKQAELVLALAVNGSAGLSSAALCTLLGADPDHPRPADAVRQLITRTRRRLGQACDGEEYIVHLGSGIYMLHEDIDLDWARFSARAQRGRAHKSVDELRTAMAMVRGQPFADCYHWWIDVALVEAMRAEIIDTADMLAQLELDAGRPLAAARAARAGLSAETAAEQLWRALMRAEHEAGNPAAVTAAWSACLDAIWKIAPGGEPHPDTERLYRELTGGPLPAGIRLEYLR